MTKTFPRNPFTREDTVLGVCQALGEDFRFNPILLRLVFATGIFINPLMTIAAYFAAGAVVLVSRLVAPNPRQPKPVVVEEAEPASEATAQPLHADNEGEALPVAA